MSTSVKELVDHAIKDNKVTVFGKSTCSFSKRAKAILEGVTKGGEIYYLDIDNRDDGSEIQAYLKALNGQGTVPHVYINGNFIGGCSDLQAIPQPQLKQKIAA